MSRFQRAPFVRIHGFSYRRAAPQEVGEREGPEGQDADGRLPGIRRDQAEVAVTDDAGETGRGWTAGIGSRQLPRTCNLFLRSSFGSSDTFYYDLMHGSIAC